MDFSELKKGCFVRMKQDRVAKVTNCVFSKPGKHGSGKKVVTGIDLINDKKYIETFKDNHVFLPFEVVNDTYNVMHVDEDGYVSLMSDTCQMKEDCQVTDEQAEQIREILGNENEVELALITTIVDEVSRSRVLSIKKV